MAKGRRLSRTDIANARPHNDCTINLDADDERYVYQVYRTEVLHQSELAVTDSGLHDITLVVCWPQYVYSERILVTAALVDVVGRPTQKRT